MIQSYRLIGFIERGRRQLSCKNKSYVLAPGDVLLFNPGDNHACAQVDGKAMDYGSIHVQPEVMRQSVFEVMGRDELPCFARRQLSLRSGTAA